MINHSKQQPDNSKFYGNYRALVVDNEDEYTTGRVKVRVYGIHDGVDDDALPWAIRKDPLMNNSIIIPDIGSEVWVFFECGYHDQPVYDGGAPARLDKPEEVENNYPNRKVIKTSSGFVFEIDDTEGETSLTITQPNGNIRHVDHEGNEEDTIEGDLTINVLAGKVTINSDDIRLGDETDLESAVLGEQLAAWVETELTPWLNNIQVIGNMGSPTSTPIVPFEAGSAANGQSVYSKKVKVQP